MKTLLIESNALIRRWYDHQICSIGFECTSCATAATALEACCQTFYPLIISTLELPDMDGIRLCRRLRSLPHGKRSKILMISARCTLKDIQAAKEAGADQYLIKPVGTERFRECIATLQARR